MKQKSLLILVILFIATATTNIFNYNFVSRVFAASSCNSPCSFAAGGNCSSCSAPKTCSTGYFGGSVYGSCCCPAPTATPKPPPQPDGCVNSGCNWDPLTSSQHACNPGEYCRANSSYPGTCYCATCSDIACGSDTNNCHNISATTTCNTSVIPCVCITPTPTPTPTPDCSNTSFASACYGLPGGGSAPGPGGSCPAGQELKTFTYATGSSTCCCPTPTPTSTPSPSPTPILTPSSTPSATSTPTPTPTPPIVTGPCHCDPGPAGFNGSCPAPNSCTGTCTNPSEICQKLSGITVYYCGCSTKCENSFPGCGGGCPTGKTCQLISGNCVCN